MSTNPAATGQIAVADIDSSKVEAFAGRMISLLNDSFLAILVSIGHQTNLFDTLASLPPSTSDEIAAAAGLNKRYVKEWLGAMVTGRIVEYDAARRTYRLPAEHAALLTRAAGADNFAMFTQYVALCGLVEPKIVHCFREGGGVPYSEYPKFQALQAEESAMTFDAKLIGSILPLAPGVIDALQAGADVLDLGCGQGHGVNLMARAFPRSRFTGWDFSSEGIAAARDETTRLGHSNARFEARDLATLDAIETYDLILAVDVIHDLAEPDEVLARAARALKLQGTFLMIDIAASSDLADNIEHPLAPFLYSASVLHCMAVSLAQGGPGLGTVWGEQKACEMLAAAGFTEVEVKRLDGDILHAYYVARR